MDRVPRVRALFRDARSRTRSKKKRFFPKDQRRAANRSTEQTPQSPRGGACRASTASRRAGARARAPRRRAPRSRPRATRASGARFRRPRGGAPLRVGGGFARRAPSRRRAHALGVRLRLLRRRRGLRRRLAPFSAGSAARAEGLCGGSLSVAGVFRVSSVFFSPPNTENGILAGADRGATGGAAPLFATPRFSPSSGKTPGVAGAVGAPSRSSAMDDESDEPSPERSMNERVMGRPRRPNGARPRRRGSTARATTAKRATPASATRTIAAASAPYSLSESSGIGPSRASRRAALRLRARRRDGPPRRRRAGPRRRERALGLFGAARRRIRADRIGVFGVAPARRPRQPRLRPSPAPPRS